ncbi:unnamed protein product [Notodromas monacha]|uniref:Glycine cleavage system H protein n=1 Tax=Notodromas monacha TaxID=399045 RepID=A0A7R9BQB1_9CRUS|nr:unnamed protein product [Notodromas monacha]CAG0918208.1 unnamed protein product [Notodromas monacha]
MTHNLVCVRRIFASIIQTKSLGRLQEQRRSFTASSFLAARLFTPKHEWVDIDGKIGTVGISDHAQQSLGDIVYCQLPNAGQELSQSGECGALESVKAASEVYSPVSGKVIEKNSACEDSPGLINTSCYGEGWLFKIELAKPEETKELMSEEKYLEFLATQE